MAFEAEKLPHENPEVRTRMVLLLVFGFLAFAAVLTGLLGLFYRSQVRSGSLEAALRPFPAPQLQPNPQKDYEDFLQAQRAQLAGTRWVDAGKGLIHVPIERAMAVIAAKGAAAYDPMATTTDAKPPPTPQDGAVRLTPSAQAAPYGIHP